MIQPMSVNMRVLELDSERVIYHYQNSHPREISSITVIGKHVPKKLTHIYVDIPVMYTFSLFDLYQHFSHDMTKTHSKVIIHNHIFC